MKRYTYNLIPSITLFNSWPNTLGAERCISKLCKLWIFDMIRNNYFFAFGIKNFNYKLSLKLASITSVEWGVRGRKNHVN